VLKPLPGEKHVVKFNFGPRTRHFARGFTEIDDLILDESYDLVPAEVANLTGAQAASPNPQTIYASTPPVITQHPHCHRFSGLVRTVESGGAPGLYGALYRAPRRFERGDPAAYPLAQPSYGVVGNDREMAAHLQGARDAGAADLALFDADWLGWGDYPPPENGRSSEIGQWESLADPGARVSGPRVVVLTREKTWAITAAQRTTDGRIHIEVGWADDVPAAAVVRRLVDVVAAWNPAAVVVGRGASAQVLPELEAAGIEAVTPNRSEEAQACGGFLSDATSGALSHSGQPGLAEAMARAYRHELPSGGFVWQVFDPVSHAQLVGATLARWALLKFGSPPRRKSVGARTGRSRPRIEDREVDAMSMAF
ncbi:MAG TPA: terminase, partial [Mycobacterium sp.]|nr:terminase [Mycobacterium sp.]